MRGSHMLVVGSAWTGALIAGAVTAFALPSSASPAAALWNQVTASESPSAPAEAAVTRAAVPSQSPSAAAESSGPAVATAPTPTPTAPPTPTPTPTTPVAVAPEVIKNGPRDGSNKVALTFDADLAPDSLRRVQAGTIPAQINVEVLDYLEQTNTPATVFVTGMWAQQYPGGMQRLAANPLYEVGNHSWDHMAWTAGCYGLPVLPGNASAEVSDTAEAIKAYTGTYPKFFRFPGLCHDDADVALVAANGERVVDTDISGSDAFAKNGAAVASSILNQVQPGSIIVLHLNGAPNAGTTAEIVRNLVPALKEQGLQPVTLSGLLG